MEWTKIVVLLSIVVLVSGCTGIGLPDGLFGSDVVNIQKKTVDNGVKDIISINNVQTIPSSPMLPDQQVVLSFILANNDNLEPAVTTVDLFNAPTMRSPNPPNEPCNLYVANTASNPECGTGYTCIDDPADCVGTVTGNCGGGTNYCCLVDTQQARVCLPENNQCGVTAPCTILPHEEKPVTFVMKTPTSKDIKDIKTSTQLNFKVLYKFGSSLNYIVPAVSNDEILKRQRTGEKIDLQETKSYSSGPLQIDADIVGAPYIFSNGADSPESIITFTIHNRGSGSVVNSLIAPGAMKITFPPELVIAPGDKFTCTSDGSGTTCVNQGKTDSTGKDLGSIPLYRDESRSSIRFTVKLAQPFAEPFRSFQIGSTVVYDYELRNSQDVTINPFQNV